ncbi:MAG: lantibiotic dehydratase, partial [Acidobacteriota bacterium]
EVCADPSSGLDEEAEAYRLFGSFLARGWIDWNFFVPVDPYAREALLEQIESIGEETLRQTCLATFRELDEARAAIAGAAGDVPALDGALARLNESFTRLAGQAATRNEGEAYGGRTLVYEDCLRDLELEIGPEIRREMAEALSVVLPSARWFTHQVTASFRQVATEIYRQMAPSEGAPVPAPLFWEQLQPLFDRRDPRRILGPVLGQLHDRWRELLGLSDGAQTNRLQLSSESLKDAARAAFEAPRAGWEAAINQSPDVMIAARSVEAIRAGDYELVLGEIHVGRNSLNSWVFVSQHPDRQQFFREIDDDLPEPRFWVTRDRNSLGVNTRTSVAWVSPQDYVIPPVDRMFVLPQSQTLPPAALVVVETENGVMLCTRDGQLTFDITKAGSQFISQQLMDSFGFLGAADHLPRVTIDRLTICRESWAFDPETLEFARQKDGAERFLAARRWAREHGLPRYIFVRVPVEAKPFYIDFDSPIYVDILAKSVRATLASEALDKRIRITEMLPTPEQTWLPDADGQRYSSELRIVLKDRTW